MDPFTLTPALRRNQNLIGAERQALSSKLRF
jgi:hypothetical protein